MPKRKTAISTPEICKKHNLELKYSEAQKIWYCPKCIRESYESYLGQQVAQTKYNQSDRHKEAQERYNRTKKGQEARQRYLKSDKYKAARKRYNAKLKESLAIARRGISRRERAQTSEELERDTSLAPLVQDAIEFTGTMRHTPSVQEVIEWATDVYSMTITAEQAKEVVRKAEKHL